MWNAFHLRLSRLSGWLNKVNGSIGGLKGLATFENDAADKATQSSLAYGMQHGFVACVAIVLAAQGLLG
jgi:hypothetical protein